MSLVNLLLAFAPLGLVATGGFLLFFGWMLGGAQSRLYLILVVVTALSACLSQVSLGIGLARPGGLNTPAFTLYTWSPVGDAGFQVNLSFRGDLLSFLFALPLTVLTLLCVIYLLARRPQAETQDGILPGRLYGLIFLAEGAGLGAFYSADLIFTYFWIEAAGLALYLLSGPGLRGAGARPASYRALGVSFLAGQAIFAPLLVMVSRNGGRSTYSDLIPAVVDATLFGLVVAGCLAKAAQFPFQSWLGSFEDLPAAAYALLTAGLVFPLAVYLPVRLQALVGEQSGLLAGLGWMLLPVGAFTVLFAALMALRQTGADRLLARTGLLAAAQFGFITVALGLNDLEAAFQQLLALLAGAPLMFLCADQLMIENAEPPNPDRLANPRPLARPPLFRAWLAGFYLVGLLNFAGFPFSPAYTARWQTLNGLLESGHRLYFAAMAAGLVVLLAALFMGLLVFLNGPRRTADGLGQEWYAALAVPGLLAAASLALGFYPGLAANWIGLATQRAQPEAEAGPLSNPATGWLGLLLAILLALGLLYYWRSKPGLVAIPFLGGLVYGPATADDKPRYARTGRSKMALKIVEAEEELPEGFEDEFFSGAYKKKAAQPAQARRVLPDPRLDNRDYFGLINERVDGIGRLFDTGYLGGRLGSLLLGFLDRTRRVFEWTIERFYPALAAFILLAVVILLTR